MNKFFVVLIVIFFIIFIKNSSSITNPPSLLKESNLYQDRIEVQGINNKYKFSYVSPFRASYNYMGTQPLNIGFDKFTGITILPTENYQEYQNIKSSGTCPAPLLNQYARLLIILTDDKSLLSIINKNRINKGDKVVIEGTTLSPNMYTKQDQLININIDSKISFVYLKDITVEAEY